MAPAPIGTTSFLVAQVVGNTFAVAVSALLLVVVCMALFLARGGIRRREWLHPMVAPLGYLTCVMIIPVIYVVATGSSLGPLTAHDLNPETVAMMAATVVTLLVGMLVAIRVPYLSRTVPPLRADWSRVLVLGRVILLACVLIRGGYALTHPATVYGRNQLAFDSTSSIQSAVQLGILIAVVLIVVGNLHLHRGILQPIDLAGLCVYTLASLYTGSRFSIVGPMIFVLWAYHTHVKRISLPAIIGGALAAVLLLEAVGIARSTGTPITTGPAGYLKAPIVDLSSPLYVTNEVIRKVPSQYPFANGSTYLAAIKRQLPGPAADKLFGPPTDTGAYRFRVIEGNFNPNQGYSFALPAEGYLNFGLLGVIAAALLLGLSLGLAWIYSQGPPTRVHQLVYPLMLAALPYGLRSDALTQIKLVVTPLLAIAVVLLLCRRFPKATARQPAGVTASLRSEVRPRR